MPDIKCMVEECKYNNACHCDAHQVAVCSCGCSNVTSSSDTACDTFSSRNQD
ncbi:MAG: DUF1540 domain-containing protein [Clostridiales bacterium]